MQLQDNEYITEAVVKLLIRDDWTMEKLATAKPATLAKYKGVGKVTAAKIIDEAKELVNEEKLYEASLFEVPEAKPQPTEEEPPPPMSARVRRLKELNK